MGLIQITPENSADEKPNWLELVRRQVESLRYGVVQIVVHDARVIQIEKTERLRLGTGPAATHLKPTRSLEANPKT